MNGATGEMRQLTYREAVREAIREALHKDERVFLMGEDVGRYGGCFAVSKGLSAWPPVGAGNWRRSTRTAWKAGTRIFPGLKC